VYEGLTQYLAFELADRSGIRTPQQNWDNLALVAASLDNQPGRTWRPLSDTAVEAQLLFQSTHLWESWRRRTDFYNEGLLIWLEADVLIRQQTKGAKFPGSSRRWNRPASTWTSPSRSGSAFAGRTACSRM
jgi:predicted metalloprotease with PDZ domain